MNGILFISKLRKSQAVRRQTRRAAAASLLAVTVAGISASAVRADLFVSGGATTTSTLFRISDAGVVTTFATNTTTGGTLISPRGLAVGADGFLYVANNGGGNILRFNASDTSGAASATVFATAAGNNDLAFDSASNLYVTNPGSGTLTKIDASGAQIFSITGVPGARGVAVGPDGNIYVSSNTANDVKQYDALGNFLGVFATTAVSNPREIEFGADGNLYVVNNTGNTITRYDSTGAQIGGVFATTGISNPQGLAVDTLGNFYVANNSGGAVRKFDSTGVSLGNANATTLSPTGFGIAYAPSAVAVPEPGTFGLLALGLLTTGGGFIARRRRRAA